MTLYILCALAVARAVRLWRDDKFMEGWRGRVDRWLDCSPVTVTANLTETWEFSRWCRAKQYLAVLIECPWCLSGWLTLLVVVYLDAATPRSVPLPVLSWFATWWLANLAYWLLEAVADLDSILWNERENRDIDD